MLARGFCFGLGGVEYWRCVGFWDSFDVGVVLVVWPVRW